MNIRGSLSNIRVRLNGPRAQKPSDRSLLVLLSTQVQNLLTEANLRGRYWAVDFTDVTVNPNVTEYALAVEGFGKPIEVRAVYPGGDYPEHDVDFYDPGDLNFESPFVGSQPAFDTLTGGQPYMAQRASFYRKNGTLYLRTAGVPQAGATYRIFYQIGVYGQTLALDEELLFPEFYMLAELRTAISALPHSEWFDSEDRNESMRKQLGLTLDLDEKRTYALFKSYVASQTANDQPNYRLLDDFDT